jgi:uncharacterized membrane protein
MNMPKTTFAGHPLHPQLVELPLGLLPFSCLMDLMHCATGNESYAETAYHCMVGGVVGGLAAGTAGTADYLTIPAKSQSKRVANLHGLLNVGVMGLYGLNLYLRSRRATRPGAVPVLLSLLGTAGLVVSSWYGGELVYKLGMRVEPAMEGDQSPEWKLPSDQKVAKAFRSAEKKLAPAGGPQE